MKKIFNQNLLFVFLVSFIFVSGSFLLAQDAKPFIGTWTGNISAEGTDLEIVVKFSLDKDNAISGTIDIPMQDIEGMDLGEVEIDGNKISFIIDDPNITGDPTFSGELDKDGKILSGDFSQGGAEGTFELTKEG